MEPTANKPNSTTNINTDGGTGIQGNVDVGENFTGRDSIHGPQYNVAGDYIVYQNADGTPKNVPNQLPRRTTNHFTGRQQPLNWIAQNLKPAETLVISGPGGMGKTTLTIEAVNRLAAAPDAGGGGSLYDLFPDGIIFHTFYGRPQIALAFETLITAYGHETKGDVEQLARQTMGGKRALVILDGCEDVKETDGLRRVVDVLGQCGVLVSTRAASQGRLGLHRRLDRLQPDEALLLLKKLVDDKTFPNDVGAEICTYVDHLPLGVDIAGNYLRERGEDPKEYLTWLQEAPIEALDQGETRRDSMYRMVSKSAERIDGWGKEILLLLGQMAYLPLPVWAVESILAVEKRALDIHLREMARYGLVSWDKGQLACTHALVHGYARDQHFSDKRDGTEMLDTVWRWLNENYRVWQKATPPAFDNCDALRGHALGVLARLEQKELWEAANKLVWALGPGGGYLALQGHFTENIIALETGIRVCQQMEDRSNENQHLINLGLVFMAIGQVEKSIGYFEQGLLISRDLEDQRSEGAHLGNLGLAYSNLGRVEEAIEQYEAALEISREIGDRRGEGNHLGNLGLAYSDLGRVEGEIEQYEAALVIQREIGDRRGEGNQLGNLGLAYSDLGRVEEAIVQYEPALEISREIGDRRGEGADLGNLGNAYRNLGQHEKALDYQQQADLIDVEIG
ncbi:MAG: tetratricopeptide repeat protein, partial [Anaerolineae bacterium]